MAMVPANWAEREHGTRAQEELRRALFDRASHWVEGR
jgi:hypothetical protein